MHLADYMQAKGLSDDDVAAKLKVSRPTVSRIRRKLTRPNWDTIKKIRVFTKNAVTAEDFTKLEAS